MSPIEIVATAFVVGSFVAIGARFTPRDAFGVRRAPRPIDNSIGMYAFRRLRRRSTLTEADLVQPTLEEIQRRLGIAPAQAALDAQDDGGPTVGAEALAAAAVERVPEPAGPLPPGDLLAAMRAAVEKPPPRPGRRVSQAALSGQRRVGGLIAATLIVAAGLGGASLVGAPGGEVLHAVGTPGPSASEPDSSADPASAGSAASPAPVPTSAAPD